MTISEAKERYDRLFGETKKAESQLSEYAQHIKTSSVQIMKDMYGIECYLDLSLPTRWDQTLSLRFKEEDDSWGGSVIFTITINHEGVYDFRLAKTINNRLTEDEIVSLTTVLLDLKRSKGIFSVLSEYNQMYNTYSANLREAKTSSNDAAHQYERMKRENAEKVFYDSIEEGDTLSGFYIERITDKSVVGISYGWKWEDGSTPRRRRIKKSEFYQDYKYTFND